MLGTPEEGTIVDRIEGAIPESKGPTQGDTEHEIRTLSDLDIH
jgi:hypothetical protein